jgi:CDP-diacylglycerol pyrophosphatase
MADKLLNKQLFRIRSLLHKLATFVAPIGLIAPMVAGQPQSASAANRVGLWFVVHDICLPATKASASTRSQDQLHIHVACIAPVVADFLRRRQSEIHGAWSPLRAKLAGRRFLAMKVETESLAEVDPFKLLRRGNSSNRLSMGRQTLAVVGATFRNGKSGFYVLANDTRASPRDTASAEALLDDKCAN